jgi:hypothetical protein
MLKPGVDLRGLQPQLAIAYCIAPFVYSMKAGQRCVITSCSDGKHGPNSLHYKGRALDLRTSNLRPEQVHPVFITLKEALGESFDTVLESDHIHLEWDPKEPLKEEDWAVDEHVVDMIRDSLNEVKETCQGIRDDLKEHTGKDEKYWSKIDAMEGQISLIKWVSGGLSISGLGAWLFSNFGKH